MRCVVLISGRGSNLNCLLANAEYYSVVAVLSNCEASGLAFSKERGIPTRVIPRPGKPCFENRVLQQQEMIQSIEHYAPDWIILAGFMQILLPEFIEAFRGRIINIHPSLLPDLPGLDTHQRAIEQAALTDQGCYRHGCSVHLVDEGVDTGEIIAQAALVAQRSETPEQLASRVLKLEHSLYPWVLNNLAQSQIGTDPLAFSSAAKESATRLGFSLGAGLNSSALGPL